MTKQYNLLIVAIFTLLCSSCTHTETTYYPNGNKQSVIQYRGKKEHGPVMILLSVLMAAFIWKWGRINRFSGALLAGIYVIYAIIILAMPDLAM